jgi:hypothetical protein
METSRPVFDLLVVAAATQRLLSIWISERVMAAPRTWAQRLPGSLGYLASCPYCLSVWFAAGAYGAWEWGGPVGQFAVAVLAASSLALAWNALFVIVTTLSLPRSS